METKTLELTVYEIDTLIDCVTDRLEAVEDLLTFEQSNGNEEDARILSDVRNDLEDLLNKL